MCNGTAMALAQLKMESDLPFKPQQPTASNRNEVAMELTVVAYQNCDQTMRKHLKYNKPATKAHITINGTNPIMTCLVPCINNSAIPSNNHCVQLLCNMQQCSATNRLQTSILNQPSSIENPSKLSSYIHLPITITRCFRAVSV